MTNSTAKQQTALDAEQVEAFLKQHPDFFVGRDALLLNLQLPHRRGTAISLVEHQLALYRERDRLFQRRLASMTANARENDRLFGRIRQLVLALLECRSLEQTVDRLSDSLSQEFNIEYHNLILYTPPIPDIPVRFQSREAAESMLGAILGEGKPFCGALDSQQTAFLFDSQAGMIQSLALAPLNFPDNLGLLVLGSAQENHFRVTMGSLFIGYLGDVLSRVLSPWFARARP